MSALAFIDTNILLDFYRVSGPEKGLSLLEHIDKNHQRFITGSQIEMEFKKNRQHEVLEARRSLKPTAEGKIPAFLALSKQSTALARNDKQKKKLYQTLRLRTEKILRQPSRNDQVYKVAQRLFRCQSPWNLSRDKKVRFEIRRLARKRFVLGYPPRKPGDTSIGDAINWEWIVYCAVESRKDIVIVSRDTDFGVTFDGESVLNDWLAQEFRERVSRRRKIALTNRLSVGLREANISVTAQEERGEDEFLKRWQDRAVTTFYGDRPEFNAAVQRVLSSLVRQRGSSLGDKERSDDD